MKNRIIRTAEFVSPKHPDKLCDYISDLLVDLYISEDPYSRCAIETAGGHNKMFITGEVTSKADISDDDIKTVVNNVTGISDITVNLVKQSPEIARGVDTGGAGDQGIMIGYACRSKIEEVLGITEAMKEYMPEEYYLARKLNKYLYNGYLQTDGKTQITFYEDTNKVNVVCSFQNSDSAIFEARIREFLYKNLVRPHNILVNPAGEWTVGGLDADAGLTGRKIVVDAYGPRVPVGGGAFSGKDATKVDRSAAYMARKMAKDYLKRYDANEVLVRLAYAIGHEFPVEASMVVDGVYMDVPYVDYDLRPQAIIERLDLRKPIFAETAKWGHFGHPEFTWEQ